MGQTPQLLDVSCIQKVIRNPDFEFYSTGIDMNFEILIKHIRRDWQAHVEQRFALSDPVSNINGRSRCRLGEYVSIAESLFHRKKELVVSPYKMSGAIIYNTKFMSTQNSSDYDKSLTINTKFNTIFRTRAVTAPSNCCGRCNIKDTTCRLKYRQAHQHEQTRRDEVFPIRLSKRSHTALDYNLKIAYHHQQLLREHPKRAIHALRASLHPSTLILDNQLTDVLSRTLGYRVHGHAQPDFDAPIMIKKSSIHTHLSPLARVCSAEQETLRHLLKDQRSEQERLRLSSTICQPLIASASKNAFSSPINYSQFSQTDNDEKDLYEGSFIEECTTKDKKEKEEAISLKRAEVLHSATLKSLVSSLKALEDTQRSRVSNHVGRNFKEILSPRLIKSPEKRNNAVINSQVSLELSVYPPDEKMEEVTEPECTLKLKDISHSVPQIIQGQSQSIIANSTKQSGQPIIINSVSAAFPQTSKNSRFFTFNT